MAAATPAAAGSKADRIFNFSAGPAMLPIEVLEQAAAHMYSYQGCGMSVMEMSHRSKEFETIIAGAEADLRALLSIPDNYKVLFLQGGASTLFSMIPLNLTAGADDAADYVVTGSWSKKALEEGAKFCAASAAAKEVTSSITRTSGRTCLPNSKKSSPRDFTASGENPSCAFHVTTRSVSA